MKLRVCEIFQSLEGEGTRVGTPQTFVRLQGCKVRCRWCDTPYALDPSGGQSMSLQDIVRRVEDLNCHWVSITGGDPLFQKGVEHLVVLLRSLGYSVNLEVPGTVARHPAYGAASFISADIKTPSSGVKYDLDVPRALARYYRGKIQLKAVIVDEADLDFLLAHFGDLEQVVLTPEGSNVKSIMREVIVPRLSDLPATWRVIPQIHKLVELP